MATMVKSSPACLQACGVPVLKIFNLNLEEEVQRKGLGTRMVQIAEMVARQSNMCYVHGTLTCLLSSSNICSTGHERERSRPRVVWTEDERIQTS